MRGSAVYDEIVLAVKTDPLDGRFVGRQDPFELGRVVDPVEPDVFAGRGVFFGDAFFGGADNSVRIDLQYRFGDQFVVLIKLFQNFRFFKRFLFFCPPHEWRWKYYRKDYLSL